MDISKVMTVSGLGYGARVPDPQADKTGKSKGVGIGKKPKKAQKAAGGQKSKLIDYDALNKLLGLDAGNDAGKSRGGPRDAIDIDSVEKKTKDNKGKKSPRTAKSKDVTPTKEKAAETPQIPTPDIIDTSAVNSKPNTPAPSITPTATSTPAAISSIPNVVPVATRAEIERNLHKTVLNWDFCLPYTHPGLSCIDELIKDNANGPASFKSAEEYINYYEPLLLYNNHSETLSTFNKFKHATVTIQLTSVESMDGELFRCTFCWPIPAEANIDIPFDVHQIILLAPIEQPSVEEAIAIRTRYNPETLLREKKEKRRAKDRERRERQREREAKEKLDNPDTDEDEDEDESDSSASTPQNKKKRKRKKGDDKAIVISSDEEESKHKKKKKMKTSSIQKTNGKDSKKKGKVSKEEKSKKAKKRKKKHDTTSSSSDSESEKKRKKKKQKQKTATAKKTTSVNAVANAHGSSKPDTDMQIVLTTAADPKVKMELDNSVANTITNTNNNGVINNDNIPSSKGESNTTIGTIPFVDSALGVINIYNQALTKQSDDSTAKGVNIADPAVGSSVGVFNPFINPSVPLVHGLALVDRIDRVQVTVSAVNTVVEYDPKLQVLKSNENEGDDALPVGSTEGDKAEMLMVRMLVSPEFAFRLQFCKPTIKPRSVVNYAIPGSIEKADEFPAGPELQSVYCGKVTSALREYTALRNVYRSPLLNTLLAGADNIEVPPEHGTKGDPPAQSSLASQDWPQTDQNLDPVDAPQLTLNKKKQQIALRQCFADWNRLPPAFSAQLKRSLNPVQVEAVQIASYRPGFTFIQGPPGTGKTTAVHALLSSLLLTNPRVLIAAPSNAAIDEIMGRVMKNGIVDESGAFWHPNVIRVGKVDKIRPALRRFALNNIVDTYMKTIDKRKAVARINELEIELNLSFGINIPESMSFYDDLRLYLALGSDGYIRRTDREKKHNARQKQIELERLRIITSQVNQDRKRNALCASFLAEADVVFATCNACGSRQLNDIANISFDNIYNNIEENDEEEGNAGIGNGSFLFECMIIDEAAQCEELSILIALGRLAARGKCICVGDPRQLPATVFIDQQKYAQ